MTFHLVGELPRHIYCFVDSAFTHKEPIGLVPSVWFGLVAYPGRAWGCTVMLESGAIYRNIPPHAICFSGAAPMDWHITDTQTWDCYGSSFTTIEYGYLAGLDCKVMSAGEKYEGSYLFTAAPIGDGFSAYPEQAKEFCFIQLDNGRLTIQPTNHIVFRERSFTGDALEFPQGLARQSKVWSVE